MLRLAAVKSERSNVNGESISLTQLESLPLEVQLQVVNNDEQPVGLRPSRRKCPVAIKKKFKAASPPVASRSPRPRRSSKNTVVSSAEPVGAPEADELPVASCTVADRGFYQENVVPMSLFMDENPSVPREAVDDVTEFLSLCVSERRVTDAIVLLRNIKNRRDAWTAKAYPELVRSVDDLMLNKFGHRLDLAWHDM